MLHPRSIAAAIVLAASLSGCAPAPSRIPHAMKPTWRQYEALPDARALALAGDPDFLWVAGALGGQASREDAEQGALAVCQERRQARRMQAPCRLYAVDSEVVWTGP